jgi:hypothetical protein
MSNRRRRLLSWSLVLVLIMACAPMLTSAPPAPALDPGEINRIVEQTGVAASTQTAAAMPTASPTVTLTRTPRGTDTPEPAITETFIFVFTSPTAFVIPTLTGTFGPTSRRDYACEILNSPTDGTIYDPRLEFKVRWRFKNVGRQEWDADSIDFVYDFGDRFHRTSGYDLEKDTGIGEVAEFFVDMLAPKDPGTYTTHWTMQIADEKFCKVSLTIGVR